jgi:hypothetical protein
LGTLGQIFKAHKIKTVPQKPGQMKSLRINYLNSGGKQYESWDAKMD